MMTTNYEKRFLAYIIDYSLIFALALVTIVFGRITLQNPIFVLLDATYFVAFVYLTIYKFICYFFFGGITIAGLIFNMKIVKEDGSRLSAIAAIIRALMQAMIPLALLNVAYMMFNRTQQTIYDVATYSTSVSVR